jgi:hypothetical protein
MEVRLQGQKLKEKEISPTGIEPVTDGYQQAFS